MRDVVIQSKNNPDSPLITITGEHVKKFRQVLREHFVVNGGDDSSLSRSNYFFIKTDEAVNALEKAEFDFGAPLEPEQKFWFTVFCSRTLRSLRGQPKHAPAYIEVY